MLLLVIVCLTHKITDRFARGVIDAKPPEFRFVPSVSHRPTAASSTSADGAFLAKETWHPHIMIRHRFMVFSARQGQRWREIQNQFLHQCLYVTGLPDGGDQNFPMKWRANPPASPSLVELASFQVAGETLDVRWSPWAPHRKLAFGSKSEIKVRLTLDFVPQTTIQIGLTRCEHRVNEFLEPISKWLGASASIHLHRELEGCGAAFLEMKV